MSMTLRRTHLKSLALSVSALVALATFSASAQAPLDIRVALVIGNSAYPASPLVNPANDARAMADALRALGFAVVELRDAQKAQMAEAIDKVRETLKGKQGVGMLYYAGHGLQQDWHNYMVPVNARLNSAADVPQQTVDIETVISAFRAAGNRMNIVVLDACRDSPFASTASGKGLAPLDAPPGTFLAYATAPGNVAEDGDARSGNGLYTQFLLEELKKPSSIENLFKRVRFNVRKQSQGRQIPWESTSLEDDFYFNDGVKFTYSAAELQRLADLAKQKEQQRLAEEAAAKEREKALALQIQQERERQAAAAKLLEEQRLAALAQAEEAKRQAAEARARGEARLAAEARAAEQQRLEEQARQLEQRRLAQLKESEAREQALKAAQVREREAELAAAKVREQERAAETARLAELAKGAAAPVSTAAQRKPLTEAEREQAFVAEKADWDRIANSRKAEDFYAFLQKYPSGTISEVAQATLERLDKAKTLPVTNKDGVLLGAGVTRFRLGDRYTMQVRDGYTGVEKLSRGRLVVTKVTDEVVELNNGQTKMSPEGGTIQNQFIANFSPPRLDLPAGDYAVGKKWTFRTIQTAPNGNRFWVEGRVHIAAFEEIKIGMGTFKAYRVELESASQTGERVKLTRWMEPDWGIPVKMLREIRPRSGAPELEIYEVLARERGQG